MIIRKLGLSALALFLTFFNTINAQSTIKAVIYDYHGVLSKIDNLGVAGEIGFFNTVFYHLFDTKQHEGLEDRLLQTLEALGGTQVPRDGHIVRNGHLKALPQLMCRWMDGSFDPMAEKPTIMTDLKKLYDNKFFKNKREYHVMRNLITCMFFEPHRLNKHKQPIKEMIAMASAIKKQGKCQQFLLSNIDALGFKDLLKIEMGATLKSVIDEKNLFTSADIGYNKPHPNAYQHILKVHGLKASECVFIDDQLENVKAARDLGMIGIHVQDKNYKRVRKQLKVLGVLKKKY